MSNPQRQLLQGDFDPFKHAKGVEEDLKRFEDAGVTPGKEYVSAATAWPNRDLTPLQQRLTDPVNKELALAGGQTKTYDSAQDIANNARWMAERLKNQQAPAAPQQQAPSPAAPQPAAPAAINRTLPPIGNFGDRSFTGDDAYANWVPDDGPGFATMQPAIPHAPADEPMPPGPIEKAGRLSQRATAGGQRLAGSALHGVDDLKKRIWNLENQLKAQKSAPAGGTLG